METVTNIASAASRAIFGEGANPDEKKGGDGIGSVNNGDEMLGKEPVAGELGDVKRGEPYDKGNVDGASGATGGDATGEQEQDSTSSSLPAKSTLTSNPKPTTAATTTERISDPAAAAVLLPESASASRDTPTNLLTKSDKPSTADHQASKLPSETSESEALKFTKTDPADSVKTGAGASSSTGIESESESAEEKASAAKGTTGFDAKTSEPAASSTSTTTGTNPGATKSEGLREESLGSTGLLEEKRVDPESASEPKIGETSTSATASTPKKSDEHKKSLDGKGEGDEKEKKSLKEKIKEKLHRHKD